MKGGQLVGPWKSGAERFEAQILPHLDAANNLARWLARDRDLADDIVQDAMLRAYRGIDGLRGEDAKPWLLQIVRNCHLTARAQISRRGHVPLPEEDGTTVLKDDAHDPEAVAAGRGDARRLEDTVALLPEDFREALILREMEELSYREIADITGVPIGTIMSRLARARAMLREKWLEDELQ